MIAFITGATSGIGKETALVFAKNGYNVIITGRRKKRLNELKSFIKKHYKVNVKILSFDIRDRKTVEITIRKLNVKWSKIDVLINNAGLAAGLSTIDKGDFTDWDQMIDTNLKGLLNISKPIIELMIRNNNGGHIINIGSIAGKDVYLNGNVYCATKHAVDALTKGMRIDLLPSGIKVTGINPGMVETEFSIVRFKGDQVLANNVYKGITPLTPKDVADTIFWSSSLPKHVNINEITIMPTYQASASTIYRQEKA